MGHSDITLDNLWLPFTPNKDFHQSPRVFTGAEGMYFTTADGSKVLDGVSSLWCVWAQDTTGVKSTKPFTNNCKRWITRRHFNSAMTVHLKPRT